MPLHSQSTDPAIAPEPTEQQIEGVVTDRKKYSFTVSHEGRQYTVKLANGAPVGLILNKPWFDWKRERVVVDEVPYPENDDIESLKRVAFKLPAKELFLIARFKNTEHMERIMAAGAKRLNFYLVTPNDPGQHLPTHEQPFISGALAVQKNQQLRLNVLDQSFHVQLGFRSATLNGFSIAQLEPNKTHVFLSGIAGEFENEIIASRIVFHPILQ